jgi:hypothetical protein
MCGTTGRENMALDRHLVDRQRGDALRPPI